MPSLLALLSISYICICGCIAAPLMRPGVHHRNNRNTKKLSQLASRVVNGVPVTERSEYPFIVDLSRDSNDISTSRFCTGTLVKANIIMTAAHCVLSDRSSPIYATIGRIELEDNHHENSGSKTYRAIASIAHPQYNGVGSPNDIALMLLNASSDVKPVKLTATSPQKDEEAWLVGYGIQKLGTVEEVGRPIEVMSGRLQKTALQIKERSFCDIPGQNFKTSQGMLCTAGIKQGSSACRGDSGGGLFSHRVVEDDNSKIESAQVGIVSYGDAECMSEDSGVFTDVSAVLDWIDNNCARLQQVRHK